MSKGKCLKCPILQAILQFQSKTETSRKKAEKTQNVGNANISRTDLLPFLAKGQPSVWQHINH